MFIELLLNNKARIFKNFPGANPTIMIYNSSVVKFYNTRPGVVN